MTHALMRKHNVYRPGYPGEGFSIQVAEDRSVVGVVKSVQHTLKKVSKQKLVFCGVTHGYPLPLSLLLLTTSWQP